MDFEFKYLITYYRHGLKNDNKAVLQKTNNDEQKITGVLA
jgi:hypothetical protein